MEAYLNREKLNKYLGGELYCREERQFAVFLYNIFLEKQKLKEDADENINQIVKYCLNIDEVADKDLIIKDAYFEGTLMRDYFDKEKDKNQFNSGLLEFCLGWQSDNQNANLIKDLMNNTKLSYRNLGQNKAKKIIDAKYPTSNELGEKIKNGKEKEIDIQKAKEKACLNIASMMMNATPDILIIYELDGKEYAKALECKYCSGEGTYKDVAGAEYKMQLFIQDCIMHFCFGNCDTNKHIPRPSFKRGVWKDKGDLWTEICGTVYNGILNQNSEPQDSKPQGIINKGVELIRFTKTKNESEDVKHITINDKSCIQVERIKY